MVLGSSQNNCTYYLILDLLGGHRLFRGCELQVGGAFKHLKNIYYDEMFRIYWATSIYMRLLVIGQKEVIMSKKDARTRCFMFTLYEEEPGFEEYYNKISLGRYAGIIHDQDVDDAGQPLKPHYHFVVYFKDKKSLEQVSEYYDIAVNRIEKYNSLETALLYLIHRNQPSKFQYNENNVFGNLKSKLISFVEDIEDIGENEKVSYIIDYIDSINDFVSFSDVMKWACINNCFAELRRAQTLFVNLIREHNNNLSF